MSKKLLLVEDHPLNRDMLLRRLVKLGYEVITATDGKEAVDMTERELPDLVLMDMSLPVMDGWEATRAIKQSPRTQHTPIIALTAFVHEYDREKALAAGCAEYQTKPVDMQQLIEKIEQHALTGREP